MKRLVVAVVALTLVTTLLFCGCTQQPKEEKPEIYIEGSDTMVQMVSNLAEAYMEKHPNVSIVVSGGGSGTGIKALINGEVDIADASRLMESEEKEQIKQKFGVEPLRIIIARDMLAIVVNPSNPVDKLTIEQVAKIFAGEITNWKEVGGNDAPITLYGRQSTSGTYEFFLKHVVEPYAGKSYSETMRNLAGNIQIRDAVANDVNGIGYIGVGYITGDVKVIKISVDGTNYYSPLDEEAVDKGEYPISRPLQQYTLPQYLEGTKGEAIKDFFAFEVSGEGQKVVEQSGFYPMLRVDKEWNQQNFWAKIE